MSSVQTSDEAIEAIRNDPDVASVVEFFESHDDQTTLEYVLDVTYLVERTPGIENLLETGLQSTSNADDVRFSMFYGLCVFCRRQKEITYLGRLHEEYGSAFEDRPLYDHLRGVYLRERGRKQDFREAIDAMQSTVDQIQGNPAIHKGLANTWLTALEAGVHVEDVPQMRRRAREHIERAIDLWPEYGEYYADLGRLLAQEEQFDRAEDAILEAIDREDRNKENYAIRIADYQQHLAEVRIKRMQHELDDEFTELADQLDDLESQSDDLVREFQQIVLQTLGFFAGIMTLIVTSVQLTTQVPLAQAGQLILMLTGGLLVAFGGLTFTLPSESDHRNVGAVIGLGFLLVAAAVLLIVTSPL